MDLPCITRPTNLSKISLESAGDGSEIVWSGVSLSFSDEAGNILKILNVAGAGYYGTGL